MIDHCSCWIHARATKAVGASSCARCTRTNHEKMAKGVPCASTPHTSEVPAPWLGLGLGNQVGRVRVR